MAPIRLLWVAVLAMGVTGCDGPDRGLAPPTTIDVALHRQDGVTRYRAMGGDYAGQDVLKLLDTRLAESAKGSRIVLLLDDKRMERTEVAILPELTRLAERRGASLEVQWPRSSYEGETGIIDPRATGIPAAPSDGPVRPPTSATSAPVSMHSPTSRADGRDLGTAWA